MSFNPNGPRNPIGTTGSMGGTGSTNFGGSTGMSRTIPVEGTEMEETAEGLRGKAEHLASAVKDKASQFGSAVSEKANAAVTSVGDAMENVGHSLRDKAPSSVAPYTDRAAATLERAGNYLQQHDIGDFFDDMSGIIRRHPVPAMLTGVAIGFLLARTSRR